MPEFSSESLRVLVTILPGFLSVSIRDFFVPARRTSSFDRVLEVVSFAVANYLLAWTLSPLAWIPEWLRLGPVVSGGGTGAALFPYLAVLALYAVLFGLISGLVVGHDLHYRLARVLKATNRTGRVDPWQDAFSEVRQSWLLVHLEGDVRIVGWAEFYSEHGKPSSLFLRQARWVDKSGAMGSERGEGVLLSEGSGIRHIEFLGEGETEDDEELSKQ